MPSFPHTLIGLGPFADLGCQILFTKTAVSVIHPDGHTILKGGWREVNSPRLWRFLLQATQSSLPTTALFDKYEKPGPRGSAAKFLLAPPVIPIQCPPAAPTPSPRRPSSMASTAPLHPRCSVPLAMLAKPASSATSREWPKPWLLLPGPPQPLLIPTALISPALVLLSDSTMHALASLSNRHGWKPSKPETVTLSTV